jgi:hypothetical protein
LFDLDKKDPFYATKLEEQTIQLDEIEAKATDAIVAPLTRQFISNTYKAMEDSGSDKLEVAALAFAQGDISAEQYNDVMGDVMRTNFAHVDPKQAGAYREQTLRKQFDRLANLVDQTDPGMAMQKIESLLEVADLNVAERQAIREQIVNDKFPKAIKERLESQFNQRRAEIAGITRVGESVVPRDPRTIDVEMLENGTFRDMAGSLLDSLGITADKDPSTLTPLQTSLLSTITSSVLEQEQTAMKAQQGAVKGVERASRFLQGSALSSDEANEQWQDGGLMRLFTGNLSPDDPVFQSMAQVYQAKTGKNLPWDGKGPIPLDENTLPIVQDAALQEGRAWGKNSLVTVPRSLANTIENMALYESPERAQVAVSFWQGLGAEGQERVGQNLSARAQMVLMEANRLANNDPVGRGLAMAEITNRVRTIDQNTAMAALKLAKDQAALNDITPNPRFHYDYARALSSVLGQDVLKDEYGMGVEGFDVTVPGAGFGDSMGAGAAQGLGTIFGGRQNLVPLYAQMAVVQLGNPGISLEQAAVVVTARMREQGYKVISGTLGKQIVSDRWGHYPTDVTPSALTKQALAQKMSKEQAERFIARLPDAGPQTIAMARQDLAPADILWSYMQEQATRRGGTPANISHPSEWAFTPETNGEVFTSLMAQENGGVPMHVTIPGIGRTQLLVDKSGNPLLVASSKRRPQDPAPVDRSRIPDYFLTPHGRHKVPLKPDSAGKIEELMSLAPQSRGTLGEQMY